MFTIENSNFPYPGSLGPGTAPNSEKAATQLNTSYIYLGVTMQQPHILLNMMIPLNFKTSPVVSMTSRIKWDTCDAIKVGGNA